MPLNRTRPEGGSTKKSSDEHRQGKREVAGQADWRRISPEELDGCGVLMDSYFFGLGRIAGRI
jgi:hypothetical protein